MWTIFLLSLGKYSRRIGEVSHHNLFIILQRAQRCGNEMSEFHTPIKVMFGITQAGIDPVVLHFNYNHTEDILYRILLVEILPPQGSFCLPAKVFLNFNG